MITPINKADTNLVKRLNEAIRQCYKLKSNSEKKNAKMLRTYISGYNKSIEAQDPHPLNMVDRIVSIWLPFLAGGIPKVIIRPKINTQLKPFAWTFQYAINQWMKNMKLDQRTLEPAIFNSLFSQGIVKTGMMRADMKSLAGYLAVTSKPFSEVVDNANYVFDITAKDRTQYEFEGDIYLLTTNDAKEIYKKHADKISADYKLWEDDSNKDISDEDKICYRELREKTRFIDLWMPKERAVVTILPPDREYNKILQIIPYEGPGDGPYDSLGYKYIPDSTIPIPPVYGLIEMNTSINKLYQKAREGAERLKKIGVYEAGNEKDAETAKSAEYGGMYGFSNANAVKEITLGGVVPEIWDFLGFTLNQIAEQGGVTGLDQRARAKTATQEQMLMANSRSVLEYMSQKVRIFETSIAEKVAFEMWRNPTIQIEGVKKLTGVGEVPVRYNQIEQEGSFLDYYLDIEMYSMPKMSAEERFNKMWQILTGWIMPTAPVSAQQGRPVNVPAITKDLSQYLDVDTDSWYTSEIPQQAQMNPYQPVGGVKSADTRFGSNAGDNANNRLQYQAARQGKTTKE